MSYECDDCGMDFDTTAELANHKQKFCISSKYGNQDALDSRMEELKRIEHDLDYNTARDIRKSAGPSSLKSAGLGVMANSPRKSVAPEPQPQQRPPRQAGPKSNRSAARSVQQNYALPPRA